jgi:raffinose/stachyose/melibiose transport system permease protein
MTTLLNRPKKLKSKQKYRSLWVDFFAVLVVGALFLAPLSFIVINASKSSHDAFLLNFHLPKSWVFWDNFKQVWAAQDHVIWRATVTTLLITLLSVTVLIVISGMAGYYLQRAKTKLAGLGQFAVLSALIAPPALVPTIWVMQKLHIYATLAGIVFIEVTYGMAFAVLLFRNFMATIPKELDEAAIMDGCEGWRLYFRIIFPLLRPVTLTIAIVTSVAVFNDFSNPLYFLPGADHPTLQLTLFNFQSQYNTSWNLLFTDILYITFIPLVAFVFFNRKIVEGMTAGSVKG